MARGKKKVVSDQPETDNTEIIMPKKVNLQVKIVRKKQPKKVAKVVSNENKEVVNKKITKKEVKAVKVDPEKIEKDKKLIMLSGITFFIVLIIGFWLMNIKSILHTNSSNQSKNTASQINWNSFRDELNKTMSQIKQQLSEINQLQTVNQLSSSTAAKPSLTTGQIDQLKNNLLQTADKATTTNK